MQRVSIFLIFIFPFIVQGEVCTSCFNLSQKQIALVKKLQNSGRYSDKQIMLLIKASEAHSEKQKIEEYKPPATDEQLKAMSDWLCGEVFMFFSKELNLEFDLDSYKQDFPMKKANGELDLSVVSYAKANGYQSYSIDIFNSSQSLSYFFNQIQENEPEQLLEVFRQESIKLDFAKYIMF